MLLLFVFCVAKLSKGTLINVVVPLPINPPHRRSTNVQHQAIQFLSEVHHDMFVYIVCVRSQKFVITTPSCIVSAAVAEQVLQLDKH